MNDKYYTYRPLLDLIGYTEGTDEGDGYNETLGYGAYTGGDVDLVNMTLGQIDDLQTKMLAHPGNELNSSAVGRPQIIRTTLRAIKKKLKLADTELFDAAMQDRLACYLLGARGIDKYLSGKMTENTLINNLAKEWASLPNTKGVGHYGGQNARVGTDRVRQVLGVVQKRHDEGQPITPPVTPPVTPPATEPTDMLTEERLRVILREELAAAILLMQPAPPAPTAPALDLASIASLLQLVQPQATAPTTPVLPAQPNDPVGILSGILPLLTQPATTAVSPITMILPVLAGLLGRR